jgi:hypothetical protein
MTVETSPPSVDDTVWRPRGLSAVIDAPTDALIRP